MSIIYEALKKIEEKKPLEVTEQLPYRFVRADEISKKIQRKLLAKKRRRMFRTAVVILLVLAGVGLGMAAAHISLRRGSSLAEIPLTTGANLTPLTQAIPGAIPFQPAVAVETTAPIAPATSPAPVSAKQPYRLEGIVYDPAMPFAIINGRILQENDTVDNLVVIDIAENEVKLFNPDSNTRISLRLPF